VAPTDSSATTPAAVATTNTGITKPCRRTSHYSPWPSATAKLVELPLWWAVTDSSGAVTATADYDAYGSMRNHTGAAGTFGFTGEQTDATALVDLRARSYQPGTGRFLQADSLQPNADGTQGWSLYGYVGANPTTATDPSGRRSRGRELMQED